MNKNIIIVGAIAAGLYLLSQGKKSTITTVKKKAPRRPKRKYPKPHPHNKPIIKRVIAKKKAIYNKPKIRKATAKKIMAPKLTKPQKKKMNKAFHVPIKRQRFWLRPKPKRR